MGGPTPCGRGNREERVSRLGSLGATISARRINPGGSFTRREPLPGWAKMGVAGLVISARRNNQAYAACGGAIGKRECRRRARVSKPDHGQ
ncbi:hypothetical protein MBHK15_60033 [Marinobacter salarius]|nr:hypothetical protein MBHK15_60033 [Marinobacter salarius]